MRVLRLALAGAAVLLGVALLAAWQLPGRLDWNRYRATIEALAGASLGRPVTIAGPITLVLLPEPQLRAAEVAIGSWRAEEGAAPPLRVASLLLRVAPLPLLLGRVDARELALRGPDMVVAWPPAAGELAGWPPAWLGAFSARIEDGRLRIGGVQFTGINATLATSEAGGPDAGGPDAGGDSYGGTGTLRAAGTAQLDGRKLRFSARLAGAGPQAPSRLDVGLEGLERLAGSRAGFAGQIAGDGALSGRISAAGRDLSQLMAAPALPFTLDGAVKSVRGGLVFSGLGAELGATPLRGSARLGLDAAGAARLDLVLSALRLELDPWRGLLARLGGGLPVGLNLSAEAVELGGGTLRQAHVELAFSPDRIDVLRARAVLPGEAALRASGTVLRADPARPRFEGDASLAAPALRRTLQWLAGAGLRLLPTMPAGVMESAMLSAHVAAEPGLLALDRIDGRIDGGAVRGELRFWPRTAREPGRPAIIGSIALETLRLEPFFPAGGGWRGWLDPAALAGDFDVDLRLRAAVVKIAGEAIGPVTLDAATQQVAPGETRLTLRRLEARLRGVELVATGVLGQGGRISDGRIEATAADAGELAAWVPPAWRPEAAFWHGPAALSVQAGGPPEALAVRLALDIADARIEGSPLLDLRRGKFAGPVTLRHPGAARLLALLGLPGAGTWVGDGSLSVIAQLSGSPLRLAAEALDIAAGASRLSAPFVLEWGEAIRLTGRVNADTLALPGLARGGIVPTGRLSGWQANVEVAARRVLVGLRPVCGEASATLSLADGVLRLAPFTVALGGGSLRGSAMFDAAREPPALALDAALHGVRLAGAMAGGTLDLAAGRADGTLALTATGHGPAAWLGGLRGELRLGVDDGVLSGFDLFRVKLLAGRAERRNRAATEAGLRDALAGGPTAFARLELGATIADGTLTLHDTRLTGAAGEADLSGTVGLAGATLDLRAALRPAIADPPEIGLRLSGEMSAPRRSAELAGFLRWLAEHGP